MTLATTAPVSRPFPRSGLRLRPWFRTFLLGATLWGIAVGVLALTRDPYVVPAVVVGTFVVPVVWLMRITERRRPSAATTPLLVKLFVAGGLLGFLCSATVETPLASWSSLGFCGSVGVIEEVTKLLVLAVMTWRVRPKTPQAGFVLGAAVGFGFAAFESAGYALNALSSAGPTHYTDLASTVLVRAGIAPVTHGLWTAITGAVLFHQAGRGRFRVTAPLVLVLAAIAALHGLWDLMPNVARGVDLRLVGSHSSRNLLPDFLPPDATGTARLLSGVLDDAGLVLVAVVALVAGRAARRLPARTVADPAYVDGGRSPRRRPRPQLPRYPQYPHDRDAHEAPAGGVDRWDRFADLAGVERAA